MSFWKKRSQDTPAPASSKTGSWSSDVTKKTGAASVASPESSPASPTPTTGTAAPVVTSHQASGLPAHLPESNAAIDAIEKRFGSVRSALGAGTNIQGKLSFDVAVRIDGELGGEVYSSQPVIIGPGGRVKASIQASSLIILGDVEGDVSARDRVEVLKGGALQGAVHAPVFVLEEEAAFNGTVSMKKKSSS